MMPPSNLTSEISAPIGHHCPLFDVFSTLVTIEDYNTSDPSGALSADTEVEALDNKDKNWLGIAEYSNKACELTL